MREISELVRSRIRDPRIQGVTITDIDVSQDGSHAQIFFTTLSKTNDHQNIEKRLNKAAGFVRSEVAKTLNMRVVPSLVFRYDRTIEDSDRINQLLSHALGKK